MAAFVCILTVFLLAGCEDTVEIEYDHLMNFSTYEFTTPVTSPHGGFVEISTDGTWLLFTLCSIKNNNSESEDFHFDLSKFYVVFNGEKHYVSDISYGDLNLYGQSSTININAYPYIDDGFRSEVQTAPLSENIEAGYVHYSLNWRFAILVHPPAGINPHSIAPDLRYDNSAGESLLLFGRGHPPNVVNYPNKVRENLLPLNCRPKLN